MDFLIAMVHKGAEKIPVQITGMDDPRLQALANEHGPGAVFVDGVSMADLTPEEAPEEAPAAPAKKSSKGKK